MFSESWMYILVSKTISFNFIGKLVYFLKSYIQKYFDYRFEIVNFPNVSFMIKKNMQIIVINDGSILRYPT